MAVTNKGSEGWMVKSNLPEVLLEVLQETRIGRCERGGKKDSKVRWTPKGLLFFILLIYIALIRP